MKIWWILWNKEKNLGDFNDDGFIIQNCVNGHVVFHAIISTYDDALAWLNQLIGQINHYVIMHAEI